MTTEKNFDDLKKIIMDYDNSYTADYVCSLLDGIDKEILIDNYPLYQELLPILDYLLQ